MMRLLFFALFCMPFLLPPCAVAQASMPTEVLIRAVSKDAKIIGSGVGGARIVVQDAATGAVLAEGLQEGGTGDTRRIMSEPIARGTTVYDTEGAAGFLATLDLSRPTLVDITAYGPLGTPDALRRSSKRLLLVPGRHVRGEGIILELNGFTVELQRPTPEALPLTSRTVDVQAHVTMLCGCPTEPGGLWDADRIEIVGRLLREGRVVAEAPLAFSGTTSVYTGQLNAPASGAYTLQVLAMEPGQGNFGLAEQAIAITP